MKTLILEDNAMRAQTWTAMFAGPASVVDVARTVAQARLMMLAEAYDRLGLHMSNLGGARHTLLAVARATNPDCEIVDLTSMRVRGVSGPFDGPPQYWAARSGL